MARVLIVEDNRDNLELARYLLQAAGHTVLAAMNGAEGLACVRQEHLDLVVSDLQMPLLDGYEMLRAMRADSAIPRMPMVAVTAFSMPGDSSRALAAGFDGYLSKPIDPETFVQSIEAFLPPALRSARGVVAG
jgi:CheY-like chemotaxis protein